METITVFMKKQKVSIIDEGKGIDCTYITHLQTNISDNICFNEALEYFKNYLNALTQKYSNEINKNRGNEINKNRGYISIEGAARSHLGMCWDFYIESNFDIEFIPEVSLNDQ